MVQTEAGDDVFEPIAVQTARNRDECERGVKAYYGKRWDLQGIPRYAPRQKAFGSIRMWGNSTLADSHLEKYWQDGFRRFHPDVTFADNLKSPTAALPALYARAADIGFGHYYFYIFEAFQRHFNYDPFEVAVMTGSLDVPGWSPAFGVFVNRANPLSRVTLGQLDGIFGSARTGGWVKTEWHPEFARGAEDDIRTWGQLGLTGEWMDKRISVYGSQLRSGPALFFADKVLKGGEKWNEDIRIYAEHARADGTLVSASKQLIDELGGDRFGIGYAVLANATPRVKLLPVAASGTGPFVLPTLETVHDRSYPLVYEMHMYLNRVPGLPLDPNTKEFLRFVLSREGQEAVERDGKYLPLTADRVSEQLRKLE